MRSPTPPGFRTSFLTPQGSLPRHRRRPLCSRAPSSKRVSSPRCSPILLESVQNAPTPLTSSPSSACTLLDQRVRARSGARPRSVGLCRRTQGGRGGGRPRKITADQERMALLMRAGGDLSVTQIATALGLGRSTVYRAINHARM
uniref:helix-turn-helix domain-containing protein n=1 Tax=Microbacterium sp. LWO13-1.2 TaxID=3135262 RepID=UPI00406BFAFA